MSTTERAPSAIRWQALLFVGVSLAIGWGIRGDFGFEWGAAMPGALAAMAVVLIAGREDWMRRIPFFALFGAIGWALGGSMSYMVVKSYTHSAHSPSILYGFVFLFCIGFLWAAPGGAGTAIPAFVSRERVTALCGPVITLFMAWWTSGMALTHFLDSRPLDHIGNPVYWHGVNGLAIGAAIVVSIRALLRRHVDVPDRVILSAAVGWLATVALLYWAEHTALTQWADPNTRYHIHNPLYWHDVNWITALISIVAVAAPALLQRRLDWGERLVLTMAAGWWIGYLLLSSGIRPHGIPLSLDFHVNPWRNDNFSGSLGLVIAMLVFFARDGQPGIVASAVVTGALAGMGFAAAVVLELLELRLSSLVPGGINTNWHSIFEQTAGLFNGLALAVAMELVRARSPRVEDDPPVNRWTEGFAVAAVLLLLTYVNFQQEVNDWVKHKAMPDPMYFLSARGWVDLFYGITAVVFVWLIREHLRRPLANVPTSWLGKGQMLYVMFLWWIVFANFGKALTGFGPVRLVTEGTIHINALLCTMMALTWSRESLRFDGDRSSEFPGLWKRWVGIGAVLLALCSVIDWGIVRAINPPGFKGYGGSHVRFGPKFDPVWPYRR